MTPKIKKIVKISILSLIIIGIIIGCFIYIINNQKETLNHESDVVATINNKEFTNADLLKELKRSPDVLQDIQNILLTESFTDTYKEQVPQEEIEKNIQNAKTQYGSDQEFQDTMDTLGINIKDFEEGITQDTIIQYALRKNVDVSDDELKQAWETYLPESKIETMVFADNDDAEAFAKEADDTSFTDAVKNNDIGYYQKLTVSSESPSLPVNVFEETRKLAENQASGVIKADTTSDIGDEEYYVVFMQDKVIAKGEWTNYRDQLKTTVVNQKLLNPDIMNETIAKILEESNIKIHDDQLKDIFKTFQN